MRMQLSLLVILVVFIYIVTVSALSGIPWVANYPQSFEVFHLNASYHARLPGSFVDVRNDSEAMKVFKEITETNLWKTDGFTDGEVVDALEHFFWGMKNGVVIELGALDGSPATRSQTYEYERLIDWKRILIEGNPTYRERLKANSPLAFSAVAAICERHSTVHFKPAEYVGGILEFMSEAFLRDYHKDIYAATSPPGNVSSVDFSKFPQVLTVECMPLNHILHKLRVHHVNFFILDVEGGELEVLKSINFESVVFDVLCIETEAANRPPGYAEKVISYLKPLGYHNVTEQQGRNTWFIRNGFTPFSRPGLDSQCFNGAKKSIHADQWYLNHRIPAYQRCPLSVGSY